MRFFQSVHAYDTIYFRLYKYFIIFLFILR